MVVARHIFMQARRIGGGGSPPPVPEGSIALWSGTLVNVPANWSLCDGTGGTPNLIARFLRGAPAATEPGTTGGADSHTHASMTAAGSHTHTMGYVSHSHIVNSAGSHNHNDANYTRNDGHETSRNTLGSHTHTTNSRSHTHTVSTDPNHTHTINAGDGRPPYYEIAFIQAGAGAAVVANLIIIWTGLLANIPAGWNLCDAGDGRPDLRTRFIRGVNTDITEPGTTGGATTHGHTEGNRAHSHTTGNAAAHYHTFTAFTWTHDHNKDSEYAGTTTKYQHDDGKGDHKHANSNSIDTHNHNPMGDGGSHAHTVVVASSLPAYYDVAYIINDDGATEIPTGGILIWTGLLANIPAGFYQCDGDDGRPNLLSKFLRGSADGVNPGGEGGSDTHTHTDQDAGSHSAHSQTSAGNHQHAATDILGIHKHDWLGMDRDDTSHAACAEVPIMAGDHSHTYDNEGAHSNHSLTGDPGNHVHNPWSTDDGRPAYYEVIFMQKA